MNTVFNAPDRDALLERLDRLQPGSVREWGTMDAAQMLAHCASVLETATGDRPMKQKFIGKIFAPLVRKGILGDKPFSRDSPTDPTFIVSNPRDFTAERTRLIELIDRLVVRGTDEASRQTHAFFGKLSGEEWGQLTWKHIDHHLRQFGS